MSSRPPEVEEDRTTDLENFIHSVERSTEQIRLLYTRTNTNADRLFGIVPITSSEDDKKSENPGSIVLLTNALAYLTTAINQLEHELDRFSNL